MVETPLTIPAMLKDRAARQPDGLAYKFVDYEADPAGFVETLTWLEVYRRARAVAGQLRGAGSPGDRVAIAAPHNLDYIVAFLGAVQAGFVAVPLPVPHPGVLDERVAAVVRDCSPVAILTTSAAVAEARSHSAGRGTGLAVIEVDGLEFDAPEFGAPEFGAEPDVPPHAPAYLQYTSGSTRTPAGVVVTHANVISNLWQITDEYADGASENRHMVSWLPFYHDMGLVLGVLLPIVVGRPVVLMTPMAFLRKPVRWIQQLATHTNTFTAGPNFAYDLLARRVADADLAGLDLRGVLAMVMGGERVHGSTIRRFAAKFGRFGLGESVLRPSYGLAEATVHVASSPGERAPTVARFDADKLSAGRLEPTRADGVELVSCGVPNACEVRIVDPDTLAQLPAGTTGEIWVLGDQVAAGYWRNPESTARTFGGRLADPSPGTPAGPWLRTGDLGAVVDGELFVISRIKDLLIVDGRNHHPDDIEATIEEITDCRSAAVAIQDGSRENLVAIAEVRTPAGSPEFPGMKRRISAAIRNSHGLPVSDLVFVAPGSLPVTSSGKIRRSDCVQRYRAGGFDRLDCPSG